MAGVVQGDQEAQNEPGEFQITAIWDAPEPKNNSDLKGFRGGEETQEVISTRALRSRRRRRPRAQPHVDSSSRTIATFATDESRAALMTWSIDDMVANVVENHASEAHGGARDPEDHGDGERKHPLHTLLANLRTIDGLYAAAPGPGMLMSMGELVNGCRRPMVSIPGQKPFHVTDPSRLQVTCPRKYRLYADHMDGQCPMFQVEFDIGETAKAQLAVTGGDRACGTGDKRAAEEPDAVDRDGLEALLTVPDLPCDFDREEEGDRTIRLRTRTKKFFIAEAQNHRHKASHFPHNPYCSICCQGHMRQQSSSSKKERKDDGCRR